MTITKAGKKTARGWIAVDAENAVVGRLASFLAVRLRGKYKPDYSPHVDNGDYIVVTNAAKMVFTGNKEADKTYFWHTGYMGGIKQRKASALRLEGRPEKILYKAVQRMMPKESSLARKQMSRLRIFAGDSHTHAAQDPVAVDFTAMNRKNVRTET